MLQTPQALRLLGREPKPRHFYEFTLNSLKHVLDSHWISPSTLSVFPDEEQRVCRIGFEGPAVGRPARISL